MLIGENSLGIGRWNTLHCYNEKLNLFGGERSSYFLIAELIRGMCNEIAWQNNKVRCEPYGSTQKVAAAAAAAPLSLFVLFQQLLKVLEQFTNIISTMDQLQWHFIFTLAHTAPMLNDLTKSSELCSLLKSVQMNLLFRILKCWNPNGGRERES